MMMSMFSVFDPVSVFGLSLNWLVMGFFLVLVPSGYFILWGCGGSLGMFIINKVSEMFSEISFPNFLGLVYMSTALFIFLGINNILGLFSFVFTGTSHLMVTLSLGWVMWMMSLILGWVMKFKESSAHLVPEGSPLGLAPFMVLIESISMMIRPITLSVRLAANMMAGHLIIGLISSISLISWSSFLVSVLLQSLMLVLECAVAFIQAFVFSVLVMLYTLENY